MNNIIRTSLKSWLALFIFISVNVSCKKLIEIKPPVTTLSEENVYNSDVSAISVLTGIYFQMSSNTLITGNQSISLLAGLSADEFSLASAVSSTDLKRYHYIDSLFSNSTGTTGTRHWTQFYSWIFKCNAAIEGVTKSTGLSEPVRKQLLGEAKLLRAFFYFYLVNLYGDVPLIKVTDWNVNSVIARSPSQLVYQQIINDLIDAQGLLSVNFLDGNLLPYTTVAERVRPTKWAATTLLARVYLHTSDFANAELQSSSVINNSLFTLNAVLTDVFKKNSSESIWQLQPVINGQNTSDGALFNIPSTGPSTSFPVYLSPQLLSGFEAGDRRRLNRNWIDSIIRIGVTYFFPFKYKLPKNTSITSLSQITEYLTVFRLAEVYLIRSEARAQLNNLNGSINDLDVIRQRAGLPLITVTTPGITKSALLDKILHERQVELFSEWGHRWLDLKRTGNIDAVMTIVRPQKASGKPWQSWMALYPIPFDDIKKNPTLTQNLGY